MRGGSIFAVGLVLAAFVLGCAFAHPAFGDAAGKGPVEDALVEWFVGV